MPVLVVIIPDDEDDRYFRERLWRDFFQFPGKALSALAICQPLGLGESQLLETDLARESDDGLPWAILLPPSGPARVAAVEESRILPVFLSNGDMPGPLSWSPHGRFRGPYGSNDELERAVQNLVLGDGSPAAWSWFAAGNREGEPRNPQEEALRSYQTKFVREMRTLALGDPDYSIRSRLWARARHRLQLPMPGLDWNYTRVSHQVCGPCGLASISRRASSFIDLYAHRGK